MRACFPLLFILRTARTEMYLNGDRTSKLCSSSDMCAVVSLNKLSLCKHTVTSFCTVKVCVESPFWLNDSNKYSELQIDTVLDGYNFFLFLFFFFFKLKNLVAGPLNCYSRLLGFFQFNFFFFFWSRSLSSDGFKDKDSHVTKKKTVTSQTPW